MQQNISKKRICIICARGGSKGLPGKNIRPLAGKPLIAYSIEHAQKSELFEEIVVSSDDSAILSVSAEYGAYNIIRPAELATDEAGVIPAIIHALRTFEENESKIFDTIVLLQATSPIREIDDIKRAVKLLEENSTPSVVSVTNTKHSPYYNLLEEDIAGNISLSKSLPESIVRRQDSPTCYAINGSIYVWKRNALLQEQKTLFPNTKMYLMPEIRSIDIDTIWDFKFAELIVKGGL